MQKTFAAPRENRLLRLLSTAAMGVIFSGAPLQTAHAFDDLDDALAGLEVMSANDMALTRGGAAVGNGFINFGVSVSVTTSIGQTGIATPLIVVTTNFTMSDMGNMQNLGTTISNNVNSALAQSGLVDDGNAATPTLGETITQQVLNNAGVTTGTPATDTTLATSTPSTAVTTPVLSPLDDGRTTPSTLAVTDLSPTTTVSTPVTTIATDAAVDPVIPAASPTVEVAAAVLPSIGETISVPAAAAANDIADTFAPSYGSPTEVATTDLASNAGAADGTNFPFEAAPLPQPASEAPIEIQTVAIDNARVTSVAPTEVAPVVSNPVAVALDTSTGKVVGGPALAPTVEASAPAPQVDVSVGSTPDLSVETDVAATAPAITPEQVIGQFSASINESTGAINITNNNGTSLTLDNAGQTTVFENTNNGLTFQHRVAANFQIDNYGQIANSTNLAQTLSSMTGQMLYMSLLGR